ncbi:hypothetical protein PISMIDRAFT_142197 [Pisolithus microcarpus 441]|uniref:Unplaced genomic scaffold scaffold_10, whole genome shotgun sequence n=1 Tax=Pisolithus microcarpus 441 TaxID=765257 RepID=A0A0C9YS22_9AGAM|nr:hypothetical protein PISMIDRAFT_142197 [Pisolithus microcarpus 441]
MYHPTFRSRVCQLLSHSMFRRVRAFVVMITFTSRSSWEQGMHMKYRDSGLLLRYV